MYLKPLLFNLLFLVAFCDCKKRFYKTEFVDVPLDHFSFASNKTFKLRYLLNDTHWEKNRGPVLLYTGNEGSIESFAENTGFIWEIAPELNALIVFAEHRYYGQSMPFGNDSYTAQNVGYLTSTQALADYIDLLSTLLKGKNNPVIAIGGSYGGMLSAYIRMKYPHAIAGAIAASAPILQFQGLVDCGIFNKILTAAFANESKECVNNIRKTWATIKNKLGSNKDWIAKTFKPCNPLSNDTNANYELFKNWLTDIYGNLAMMNYPFESDFLAPLPAYPVRAFCQYINTTLADEPLLKGLFSAISVYTNFTGKTTCNTIENTASGDIDAKGWSYQACSEMVMPMCANGRDDMFENEPWDPTAYADACRRRWGVTPAYDLAVKEYGGGRLRYASNVVFSNGLKDPWSGGGLMRSPSASIVVLIIPEGAHHLDLMDSNANDPYSVKMARQIYAVTMRKWIEEHYNKPGLSNF